MALAADQDMSKRSSKDYVNCQRLRVTFRDEVATVHRYETAAAVVEEDDTPPRQMQLKPKASNPSLPNLNELDKRARDEEDQDDEGDGRREELFLSMNCLNPFSPNYCPGLVRSGKDANIVGRGNARAKQILKKKPPDPPTSSSVLPPPQAVAAVRLGEEFFASLFGLDSNNNPTPVSTSSPFPVQDSPPSRVPSKTSVPFYAAAVVSQNDNSGDKYSQPFDSETAVVVERRDNNLTDTLRFPSSPPAPPPPPPPAPTEAVPAAAAPGAHHPHLRNSYSSGSNNSSHGSPSVNPAAPGQNLSASRPVPVAQSSSKPTAVPKQKQQEPSDRYAALKDLDDIFRNSVSVQEGE